MMQDNSNNEDRRLRHLRLMSNLAAKATNSRQRQQQVPPSPSGGCGSQSSQRSSVSSQKNLFVSNRINNSGNCNQPIISNNNQVISIETPCKQIAQLRLKHDEKNKPKAAKLLGSKSLSQMMPKNFNLFSKRTKPTSPNSKKLKALAERLGDNRHHQQTTTNSKKLSSSKSFPNGSTATYYRPSQLVDEIMEFTNELAANNNQMSLSDQLASEPVVNRIDSASLIGFPRQSTSNSLGYHSDHDRNSMMSTNLSPIIVQSSSAQNKMMQNIVASTPTIQVNPLKMIEEDGNVFGASTEKPKLDGGASKTGQEDKPTDREGQKMKTKSSKYKPFKNTALVLRDVKNSIGLRMKAKQDSQAFEKLTNEISTPPTKLYSPFNIYTPDGGENGDKQQQQATNKKELKSKKRLSLSKNNNKNANKFNIAGRQTSNNADDSGNCSMNDTTNNSSINETPKGRIVLQHKKHLLNANKFSFDSPTGRLRETVKDVEQFQQCIEDISKAIRARGGESDGQFLI